MRLADKGPIKPPPALTGPAAKAVEVVMGWTEVIAAAHWALRRPAEIDGVDFYVGDHELGHIHLNAMAHLATPPEIGALLVDHRLAKRFPYGGPAYDGWVVYRIRTDKEAEHAAWLFRLAYDRIMGTALPDLAERIQAATPVPNH